MRKSLHHSVANALLLLFTAIMPITVCGCTRAVYLGPEATVITVRSMDWVTDLGSNLWVFPQGMQRDGAAGTNSIKWTSKYGSVVASAFEAATADGINEKGLVANMLYLAESEYPQTPPTSKTQPMSISV